MMEKPFKNLRVMAIAPSSRGFGFVIFDGHDVLADFGAKAAQGNKNPSLLAKIEKLITVYKPQLVLLPETTNRGQRIRLLAPGIIALAGRKQIKTEVIPTKSLQRSFFGEGRGTKHQIAEIVAKEFPEQLAKHLPPERKDWMSEDRRMDIFNAVALGVAFRALELTAMSWQDLSLF